MKKTKILSSGTQSIDIIDAILDHHKPLKKLIKVLKGDGEFAEKKKAFEEFAPLLEAHAKPEGAVLYTDMKRAEDLVSEGFEGEIEHDLADQLAQEAKHNRNKDEWTARVKVLAELVEHHLQEEESDIFPEFKKETTSEKREELGRKYITLRSQFIQQHHLKIKDSSREMGAIPKAVKKVQKVVTDALHS